MKIEAALTARDRKIITVFGSVVIVVALVWFVIKPMWDQQTQLTAQNTTLSQQVAQATDPSLTQAIANRNDILRSSVDTMLKGFYPTMNAAQVDHLTTKLAKAYGLTIRDFSVALPTGYASDKAFAATAVTSGSTDSSVTSDGGAETPETGDLTGIYQTDVQLTLSSTRSKLQNFIDGVSAKYPGIRVKDFQWISQTETASSSAGTKWQLVIDLAIYSYEG